MIDWSKIRGALASAWEDRKPGTTAGQFDKEWSGKLGCSTSAVRRARSRYNLTGDAVIIPSVRSAPPKPKTYQDHEVEKYTRNLILEERNRLEKGQDTALRREIKKVARRDWMSEVISDRHYNLAQPDPIVIDPDISDEDGREHICVLLSDLHFGSITHGQFLGWETEFDKDIFETQFEELTRKTGLLLRERASLKKIAKIHVFLLGDIIDGEAIFPGHAHEVDVSVIDQILMSAGYISSFVNEISRFGEVEVSCVIGNHGRISKEAPVGDNWEVLLYKLIQKDLKDNEKVTMDVQRAYFRNVDVAGYKFLLVHGHQLRSTNNTSVERMVGRYSAMLGRPDVMCMGHHHTLNVRDVNQTEVIMNPAFVTSSNFAMGKLGLLSQPAQLVLGVNEDDGVVWRHSIKL